LIAQLVNIAWDLVIRHQPVLVWLVIIALLTLQDLIQLMVPLERFVLLEIIALKIVLYPFNVHQVNIMIRLEQALLMIVKFVLMEQSAMELVRQAQIIIVQLAKNVLMVKYYLVILVIIVHQMSYLKLYVLLDHTIINLVNKHVYLVPREKFVEIKLFGEEQFNHMAVLEAFIVLLILNLQMSILVLKVLGLTFLM
jgi:hypothetical protein